MCWIVSSCDLHKQHQLGPTFSFSIENVMNPFLDFYFIFFLTIYMYDVIYVILYHLNVVQHLYEP